MIDTAIYNDIAKRTGGDIYIGVVGPVRTGKSTLIKRFLEQAVIPLMENEYDRERAIDEMPQSAAGKTVMTTEPKFIPDEAVHISIGNGASMNIKLVDCVGYVVDGALGLLENGEPRMVRTPWQQEPLPFSEAAAIGTDKVIKEHATIALLVTTDGTIGEIKRESYVQAEEKIAAELNKINKPFAVILNSADPESDAARELAYSLEQKYSAPVALVNCLECDADDFSAILGMILERFPVKEISVKLPAWAMSLESGHWLISSLTERIKQNADSVHCMADVASAFCTGEEWEYVKKASADEYDMGSGKATVTLELDDGLYYRIMSEITGHEIDSEQTLISLIRSLSETKKKYDKVASALEEVNEKGYGIVMPDISELTLQEPEIVKQAGGYGVKLRAAANSIHMIKASIETEINPIVGSEAQSEELVNYMLSEFGEDPASIWQSNMFGKSLYELVNEGLHTKLQNMPDESRQRLSQTLERIINEGSGGLICIIL
ncbi:MAG: stage IV sporulation protein A [Clostridia bacterium]|nr:stage IV sporulation protein A [Clostridia bacterium]